MCHHHNNQLVNAVYPKNYRKTNTFSQKMQSLTLINQVEPVVNNGLQKVNFILPTLLCLGTGTNFYGFH